MCSSMWYMSVLALLVIDVRTGAFQHREGSSHECHVCVSGNNTTCEQSSEWSSVICPVESPFCATTAIAPNFRSSLACSALVKSPCSLIYSSQNTLLLNCVCSGHLCNVPFSRKVRNELLNYSTKNNNSLNLTETFFKNISANITDASLYERITTDSELNETAMKNSSQLTTLSSVTSVNTHTFTRHTERHPRVEALKQESTAPSDDDEDENEGSGSYEEAKSHSQPAAAPAAPSSFLPANENKAPTLFNNFYLTAFSIIQIIVSILCNL